MVSRNFCKVNDVWLVMLICISLFLPDCHAPVRLDMMSDFRNHDHVVQG
jgi:hypothetical protein